MKNNNKKISGRVNRLQYPIRQNRQKLLRSTDTDTDLKQARLHGNFKKIYRTRHMGYIRKVYSLDKQILNFCTHIFNSKVISKWKVTLMSTV